MTTYSIAQGLYSKLCGDLNGKEIQKRGDICIHTADSLGCAVETNTALSSNHIPIKTNLKNKNSIFSEFLWHL